MSPRLITPPTAQPVTLPEIKAMIRVTDDEEDTVVQALIDAAVGLADGYGGWLGRAIMPQVWAENLTMPGPWVLALPDVDAGSLTVTLDGTAVAGGAVTLTASDGGPVLTLTGVSGKTATVQYSAALPAAKLKSAKLMIGLAVDAWYANRSGGDMDGLPPAVLAMIQSLRWHGV